MSLSLIPALLLSAAPVQAAAPPQAQPTPEAQAAAPAEPVVTAPPRRHAPGDPLEGFNRRMFRTQQHFDHAFFRPAALGYKHVVPKPVRSGLRNFFSNLGEPIVFLNYLLQLKPGKAAETAGRFILNSTLGMAGLIDVAKIDGVNLPHRPNGLGDTLGVYGVKPGPFLFLPFVGPTTLRDLLGGQVDGLVLPLAVGSPFDRIEYQIPKAVITGLDQRAESDDDLNTLFAGAVDPYATLRSVYLQDREGEIRQIKGGHPAAITVVPELGEPLADPADTGAQPAAHDSTTPELTDPLTDPAAAPTSSGAPEPSGAPEWSDPLADPAGASPSP